MKIIAPKSFSYQHCTIYYDFEMDCLHVHRIYTEPNHRKRGNFKKCLSRFMQRFPAKYKFVTVQLDKDVDNIELFYSIVALFERHGFQVTQTFSSQEFVNEREIEHECE